MGFSLKGRLEELRSPDTEVHPFKDSILFHRMAVMLALQVKHLIHAGTAPRLALGDTCCTWYSSGYRLGDSIDLLNQMVFQFGLQVLYSPGDPEQERLYRSRMDSYAVEDDGFGARSRFRVRRTLDKGILDACKVMGEISDPERCIEVLDEVVHVLEELTHDLEWK